MTIINLKAFKIYVFADMLKPAGRDDILADVLHYW